MRPDVAVFVDAADDVDLAEERVARGFGAVAILEEVRIARRVAERDFMTFVQRRFACALERVQDADTDGAHDERGDGADQELVAKTTGEACGEGAEVYRFGARGLLASSAGEKIDFDHGRGLGGLAAAVLGDHATSRSARPMGSISSGAISSVTSDASAPSRTFRFASGFA